MISEPLKAVNIRPTTRATTTCRSLAVSMDPVHKPQDVAVEMNGQQPLVTLVVPSYNQGHYLDNALSSIFAQKIPLEVFVMDGGSSDNTIEVITKWESQLTGWRSCCDKGQAAAINEGIAKGRAPYVSWLNSDDWLLPGCLERLISAMKNYPNASAVYGRAWNFFDKNQSNSPVWVEPFNEHRLALRCIISQPATLIRRTAWELVGGVDESLHMAMDYDLWWKLFRAFGPLHFLDDFIAVNRNHAATKTRNNRKLHYNEAIQIVRKYYPHVPLKWWLAKPYAVWFKAMMVMFSELKPFLRIR